MSKLKDSVIASVLSLATVTYIDRSAAQWWNKQRGRGEMQTFTGWYWSCGPREEGPFRSESAAIRDAYYALVLRSDPPNAVAYAGVTPSPFSMPKPEKPKLVLLDPYKVRGRGRPARSEYVT